MRALKNPYGLSLIVASCAGILAIGLFAIGAIAEDTPSDARLKSDVQAVSPTRGLDLVMALAPVSFSWSPDQVVFPQGGVELGLIAQDVVEVLPEVVQDRGGFLYVEYDGVTAVLVAATQRQQQLLLEQAALIEEQQLEIDELRARLDALESGP